MKKNNCLAKWSLGFVILLLSVTLSVTAYAGKGDQYLLPKVGIMTIDLDSADSLYSIGALYGYGLSPELTVEGEINLGLTGGDYSTSVDNGDYRVWTVAGYGVYRYPVTKTGYLKGKLGLLYESIDRSGQFSDSSSTGFGLAGGIGGGYILQNGSIFELEATVIDQDIIFFSLGINYPFE